MIVRIEMHKVIRNGKFLSAGDLISSTRLDNTTPDKVTSYLKDLEKKETEEEVIVNVRVY